MSGNNAWTGLVTMVRNNTTSICVDAGSFSGMVPDPYGLPTKITDSRRSMYSPRNRSGPWRI